MNIQDIIKRIRVSLGLQKELPNEAFLEMLRVLESAHDEDMSCSELYEKLDEYVEREMNKKDAAELMPLIREHLDFCSDCCDEYEALLDVLNKSSQNSA
jgi:hypothetical protein